MLKELLQVRNLIEHQDADPPDLETCHRFIDIVWYFLKTTDPLVDMPASMIGYEHDDHTSHVNIVVNPGKGWRIEVNGQIDTSLLLAEHLPEALELIDLTTSPVPRKKGIVKFKAHTTPDEPALLRVVHEYFSACGYWHDA